MSNTCAIPENLSEQRACTAHEGTADRVAKDIEIRRDSNFNLIV